MNQNRRSEYAHIIFKTKASKAFWLCKALHLVHLQAHLQKKAEALLSEELSSVILEPGQKKSGFDQNHYEIVLKALGSFDKFVTLFELPEKYVSLIAEKLTQVFRYLTQVSRQQDFMTIVNHYIEQGWKDHVLANKEILKRTQLRLEEFSSSHNAKSAADYVELTALLGENSRDRLLVWLGNVNLMFKSEDIKIQLGRIVKIFPLNKDNIDLFTRIMDRLVFPGFCSEITDICKWVMYITLIKRYCPNRTFLPEQQSILEAKLTQVTAIFEKKSAIEEYNLLAQNELCSFGEALTMLNQNFSVTIPSTFLDFFNRAIKSNFRNLTSDGAKLVIKMQKKFETLTDPESKSQSNSIPVPTTFV